MTVRQQWALVGAIIAVLAAGGVAAVHFLGDELFPVTVGGKAPAFAAKPIQTPGPTPRGSLADYRGQVVLLNIWATYCVPCITEMPAIEKLHRAYGPKGLKVVGVSIDAPGLEPKIRDFLREHALTFDILYDTSRTITEIYQTTGVPETFVIGRDGVIRKKFIGPMNWNSDANRALVEQLLAEPEPK